MSRYNGIARRLGVDPLALLGLAVLVVGFLVWVAAFTGVLSGLFGSSTRTVRAAFASVEDIVPNDPVRIDGVQVGTVGGVTLDRSGRGGMVTMNLDTNDPIYRDASANIVWRTVLGANDAIAIDPGVRAAGLLGSGTLPQSQDSNQVELDQITQGAFHGGAQSGIRTTLSQLSTALSEHPVLGSDLNTLARIAPAANVGIGALRGEVQDTDLRGLIKNAGDAAQAVTVGAGGSGTRMFVQSVAATLSDISANAGALRAGIQNLDPNVDMIGKVFHDLVPVTYQAAPVLDKLIAVAPLLTPTLRTLNPTLTNLHTLLSNATPLLARLRPAVRSLASTATVGVPVIDSLYPSMVRLQRTILPGLDETTPETRGHPAYTMIGAMFSGLGAIGNYFDSNGEMANLTLGLGAPNDAGGVLPCSLDFSGTDLIVCNSLSETLATLFTGGTSLLQSLSRRPGGAALYGPYLKTADALESKLAGTQRALASVAPKVANYLFEPDHGAGR